MTIYEWLAAVYGGFGPNYTAYVNKSVRHCRIGRIRPRDGLLILVEEFALYSDGTRP